MNEDPTQNLPQSSFEERVLAALAAIRNELSVLRTEQAAQRAEIIALRSDVATLGERMSALDEKVDRRLQETRPMWEGVQAQIKKLDTNFDIVIKELYEIRYDHVMLGKRFDELEKVRS